jgi:transcriptional regulator with XRE-family HTH domain
MPGRLSDLIEIPDAFWTRPDTIDALRRRDIGRLFQLLSQYAGASQTRLAVACDMSQPKVSGIMRSVARVETLEVFERIADGLSMPDQARIVLGLAPTADQTDAQPASARKSEHPGPDIPPGDARAALPASTGSGMFSAESEDREEEEDPVRRRTFVGLTGASLIGAILADTSGGPPDDSESLASALATYWPSAEGIADDRPSDMPALAAAVSQTKRDYQACRYSKVTKDLPSLLARLRAAYAVPGTALDVARTVDLAKLTVTERKAAFFVDTARAFLQCRKDDKALLSLRAADEIAHEEVAGRPAVHRLVRDLISSAAPSTRRHAEDFAHRIGAAR